MKKRYCVISGKYRKFEKPKNKDQKIFKAEESIKILKLTGLIEIIQFL